MLLVPIANSKCLDVDCWPVEGVFVQFLIKILCEHCGNNVSRCLFENDVDGDKRILPRCTIPSLPPVCPSPKMELDHSSYTTIPPLLPARPSPEIERDLLYYSLAGFWIPTTCMHGYSFNLTHPKRVQQACPCPVTSMPNYGTCKAHRPSYRAQHGADGNGRRQLRPSHRRMK